MIVNIPFNGAVYNIYDTFKDLNLLGLVRTQQDKKIRDEGFKKHAFNVLISNQLSYHRSIPDTRHKL